MNPLQAPAATANTPVDFSQINLATPAPAATAPAPASNPSLPAPTTTPPPVTSIPTTINPPTSSGPGPTLPTPQAGTTVAQYISSVASTLDGQKAQLDTTYKQAVADKQSQIDDLTKNQQEIQQLQDNNMLSEGSTVAQETQDKTAALQLEQKQVQDNYDANQSLINEMDGLITQGNNVVAGLQSTVGGTVGFMNSQVSKTMAAITGRVGVIQAVIAARNNQIGAAQKQLSSSLDAITSIATDQINYYKAIQDYYETQKGDSASQITALTKEQQTYVDDQIKEQQDAVSTAQATATNIQNAMLDPTKALAYAKAGVTLNDTIPEINQKLAIQAYATEVSDSANKMAAAGYSSTPISGVTPVTTTDSMGVQKNWYKPSSSGEFTIGNTRFDAQGNVIAVGASKPSAAASNAASEGGALSDAQDAIKAGAPPDQVRAAFLAQHPSSSAAWNSYFSSAASTVKYPTPDAPAAKKSGLFGLGFLGL